MYSDAHRRFPRSSGFSSSPPEKSPPEAHRNDEPDDEETRCGELRLGLFAVQENHGAPGVYEKRGGSAEHRAGFESRVGCAVGLIVSASVARATDGAAPNSA